MTLDMGYAYDVDIGASSDAGDSGTALVAPTGAMLAPSAAAPTVGAGAAAGTAGPRILLAGGAVGPEIGFKFRRAVSQFTDLFSEFGRYIAPAYHHDRCERSVQMRLYSMNKREFAMVFVAFAGLYACAVIIGVAGPPITATMHRSARHDLRLDVVTAAGLLASANPNANGNDSSASPAGNTYINAAASSSSSSSHPADPSSSSASGGGNNNNGNNNDGINSTGPYLLHTPFLSSYNRQLWLLARIRVRNRQEESFQTHFRAIVDIKGVVSGNETGSIFGPNSMHNRTKLLKCKDGKCDEFSLAHLGFLHFSHYTIKVTFSGLEKYELKDVIFYFKSYNPAFTQLELWFRIIFLVCAAGILLWFQRALRRHPKRDWSMEQKWIFVLLPLLMLYNNPLFFLVLVSDSVLPSAIDSFFQATFLCALLFFWLCAYHGLRQINRSFKQFYLCKVVLVCPVWLCAVFLSIWERANQLRDPTFSEDVETSAYYVSFRRSRQRLIAAKQCAAKDSPNHPFYVPCVDAGHQNILLRHGVPLHPDSDAPHCEDVQRSAVDALFRYEAEVPDGPHARRAVGVDRRCRAEVRRRGPRGPLRLPAEHHLQELGRVHVVLRAPQPLPVHNGLRLLTGRPPSARIGTDQGQSVLLHGQRVRRGRHLWVGRRRAASAVRLLARGRPHGLNDA